MKAKSFFTIVLFISLFYFTSDSLSKNRKAPVKTEKPQKVLVGVYLNNIESIDLQNNNYYINCYIWMKWKGPIDPTKNINWLNLIDTWGLTREFYYPKPITTPDGYKYQRLYIEGKFFHKFWLGTFPLDWQKVTIEMEHKKYASDRLIFIPDKDNSGVNPDLAIPGWKIKKVYNRVKPFTYNTNFGLGKEKNSKAFSHYRFGLKIERPISFYLLKVVPPILIVLMCCFLVFLVHVSYVDVRIGTPIAVLLTEVFLYLSFVGPLPNVGIMFLIDHIFNFCYFITLLVLIVCIWTTNLYDRVDELQGKLEQSGHDEKDGIEEQIDTIEERISRIDRRAMIGFSTLLIAGTFIITLLVRGFYFFEMLGN